MSEIGDAIQITVATFCPPKRVPTCLVVHTMHDFREFLFRKLGVPFSASMTVSNAAEYNGIKIRASNHVRHRCWVMFDQHDNPLAQGRFND